MTLYLIRYSVILRPLISLNRGKLLRSSRWFSWFGDKFFGTQAMRIPTTKAPARARLDSNQIYYLWVHASRGNKLLRPSTVHVNHASYILLVTPRLKMEYVAGLPYSQNMLSEPYLCRNRVQFNPNDGAKQVRNFQCKFILTFSFFVVCCFFPYTLKVSHL